MLACCGSKAPFVLSEIKVSLGIDYTDNSGNFNPEVLIPDDGDYYFFVVNWDWTDNDTGGGSCRDIEVFNDHIFKGKCIEV